ncbi:hypothetical protein ACFE04_016650 [Oxalis oulophora]
MDEEKNLKQNTNEPRLLDNQAPPLPRFYGRFPGSTTTLASRKMEWPELVGMEAEFAKKKIKEELEGAQIRVVQPDHFVTMDYIEHRVRLYVNSSGKIDRPPRIG